MDDSYSPLNGQTRTATIGGGQSLLPTITTTVTLTGVVTTAGDSETLPKAAPGLRYTVINGASANSMNVFPLLGDNINVAAVNTAFALTAGKSVELFCAVPGNWRTLPLVP